MKKTPFQRIILGYSRQPLKTKATIWIIALSALLLILPSAIRQKNLNSLQNARIYFTEPSDGIVPGQIFPIEVRLQTTGTAVNAVSALVKYNPTFLEVVNMTTENSFCTFYLNNSFDNIKGEVNVSCGLPNPGFIGDSIVVRMNMRSKAVGTTTITLDDERTQALANDGKGSSITQELPELPLTVQAFF